MKNRTVKSIAIIAAASAIVVGCNPLNKMAKKASEVTYTVVPDPLEMHGDSIILSIKGKYPEKYFHKAATIEVTPTMAYEGGEKAFNMITLVGEAAGTEGTVIKVSGGSFSYNDTLAYVKGMENATLSLKAVAKFKTKTKDLADLEIGKGTMVTSLMVQNDEKPIMAKDNFTKTVPKSISGDVHFAISNATLRSSELKEDDMKAVAEFLALGAEKGYAWKGVSISAYASPDGEIAKNDNLAVDRANSAAKALQGWFKKNKIDAAKEDGFMSTEGKGEDWAGFKSEVEASNIADKDLIIRLIKMGDADKREQEIKALSKTYLELAKDIFPKQRRAQFTINAEETSRTDEEITRLCTAAPDSLSIEELLYGATLIDDPAKKLGIYQAASTQYKDDWRGHNNVGYMMLLQNKGGDAKKAFDLAIAASPDNAIVNNNLGICAIWEGDREAAMSLYKKATSAGSEVNYNMGIINIMQGNYTDAVANIGSENTLNAALAKTLNADNDGALKAIDASPAASTAKGYYLKAVIGARSSNKDLLINNLKTAFGKDAKLKAKAAGDAEFINYREDAEFQTLTN